MKSVLTAICLLFAPVLHADWVVDSATGCKSSGIAPPTNITATWSGRCRDGKLDGVGKLLYSDGRFIEGEFREGEPYNAHGQMIMTTNGGTHEIVATSYSEGRVFISPLIEPRKGFSGASPNVVLGKWDWKTKDGRCVETHEFKSSLESVVTSNEEVLDKLYKLFKVEGQPNVYELISTAVGSNHGKDCSGNLSTLGVNRVVYLRFIEPDNFVQCRDESAQMCYATARRAVAPKP